MSEPRSYVEGYEEDVFISYGYVDNQGPTTPWVTELHKHLLTRVRQYLGVGDDTLRIWRDVKIGGQDALRATLEQKASNSALFLSVLTPASVASEWCEDEANWFLRGSPGGAFFDNQSRIVRILKTPLQDEEEPRPLKVDTVGFKFYDEDPQSGGFREFECVEGLEGYKEFVDMCARLARAIARILRIMRKQPKKLRGELPAAPRSRTVFLADTTADLAALRINLRNELTARGHRVLPEASMEIGEDAHPTIRTLLQSADLSVHLFGPGYGPIPRGLGYSAPHLQFELATPPADGSRRRRVWIPTELTGVEPRQQALLNYLQENVGENGSTELVRDGFEKFKEDLLERLALPDPLPLPDLLPPTPNDTRSIFVICDKSDLRSKVHELRQHFLGLGYPCDISPLEGDKGEVRQAEETFIADSDATIVYYGSAKDGWVKLKRRAVIKALAKTPSGSSRTRAVYLCEPDNYLKRINYLVNGRQLPEWPGFTPLLVLGDCGPFSPEKVQLLMTQLGGAI
jgi:hypothetical protein